MGLFKKSSKKSKDDAPENPYAATGGDRYMNADSAPPPPYQSGPQDRYGAQREKSPAVTGPGQPYGTGYGTSAGFGGSQSSGVGSGRGGPQRSNGYGGLGRTPSQDSLSTDAGRQALFGDRKRQPVPQQPPQHSKGYVPSASPLGSGDASGDRQELFGNAYQRNAQLPSYQQRSYGQSGASGVGGEGANGYGSYGDRQLTAEEQENEDIDAVKQEMKFTKQQDVNSLDNTRRIGMQALEAARNTMQNLSVQGDRLTNVERNLDSASIQNRLAASQTKELDRVNSGMIRATFTGKSKSKQAEEDLRKLEEHRMDRAERETVNKKAYDNRLMSEQTRNTPSGGRFPAPRQRDLAARSKFQMEPDDSDDDLEDKIDAGLEDTWNITQDLKHYAGALGKTLDVQKDQLDSIHRKTDKVDDQIAYNRSKLDRIR